METFKFSPKGYFNLANQTKFFGNCATLNCQNDKAVVSFPIENNWQEYATVVLRQMNDQTIIGEVHTDKDAAASAFSQALSILSLDVDGNEWAEIGNQDPIIGKLQKAYDYVRPTLFHSSYEAACAFVIGNRMSIKQRRVIMQDLAIEYGHTEIIDGDAVSSFPLPEQLFKIKSHPALNDIKINRLHNIAAAAWDGILNRDYLRSLPIEMALTQLKNIPGIGEFYAQGILYRGAGIVNDVTDDDLLPIAIQKAYNLESLPNKKMIKAISSNWAPYKMWAAVLLHIWLRREVGMPKQRKFIARDKIRA